MAAYNGSRVEVGAGTLYAAPLGTTEPTAVTGAWPSGWDALGYTDKGSEFTQTPTVEEVDVEEEIWPIRNVVTASKADVAFSLAEITAQNLILAYNGGIGSSQLAAVTGTNADGSVWVDPPDVGTEIRVMIGWDSLPKASVQGTNPFMRAIYRQCFQTGGVKITHQKGAANTLYVVTFSLEKPSTLQPVRHIFPAALAS